MKSLSVDCTTAIKEADKGGAVVIMLFNGEFYKEIPENRVRRTIQKVKSQLRTKYIYKLFCYYELLCDSHEIEPHENKKNMFKIS